MINEQSEMGPTEQMTHRNFRTQPLLQASHPTLLHFDTRLRA